MSTVDNYRTIMSTFVLVHGAWHGAWCWHEVVPRLEAAGHAVHTPDLPAHGIDETPVEEATLDAYVDRVAGTLDAVDDEAGPVILVGHSMGGAVVSLVAERHPEAVDRLVYLTAFLLGDGQTLLDVAQNDAEAVVIPNLEVDEERGASMVAEEVLVEAFYADCSEAHVALARRLLRPEPLSVFETPVEVSDDRFGSVPLTYVECTADNAISPTAQAEMRETWPPDEHVSLETSHSAFFAAPDDLTEVLVSVPEA
jgi:pimeloyl-ACP methyl ester carboxylesterase